MIPNNKSVREFLVSKIASDKYSEHIIDQVIVHQFSSLVEAMVKYNSVEISGFGKFKFSQARANKLYAKYLNILESYNNRLPEVTEEKELNTLNKKLDSVKKEIEILKPKLL